MFGYCTTSRFIATLLFCMAFLFSGKALLSQQHEERKWADAKEKFSITATMVGGTNKNVLLKTNDGREVKVPLSKLREEDRLYAQGWMIVEREKDQYDLVMPHIERYRQSPVAVVEILHAIHRQIPDAPYAACMIGLAYASGKANYSEAEKYFNIAARTIKNGQKILGPEFHAMTETAVRNNLAVCACKLGKGDRGIKHIGDCRQTEELQFCLYHNATLILESQKFELSNIRISTGARRKLVDFLAQKPPANPEFSVPPYFLYLLEWNAPITGDDLQVVLDGGKLAGSHADKANNVSGSVFQTEKQLRDKGFIEHSQGTGFLIDSDLVVTNRHVVKSKSNDLSYTITQFLSDGSPKLVGGSIVRWSPVLEQDLAMIKLDRPVAAAPMIIDPNELIVDDEVTVIGFPNTAVNGEHILASVGFVEDVNKDLPWLHLSSRLQPGSSGSPCVDMAGNVLGVAFARESIAGRVSGNNYSGKSLAVDTKSLIEFVKSVKPEFEFSEIKKEGYKSKIELCEKTRQSVFLIKSWIPPTTRVDERNSRYGSSRLTLDPSEDKNGWSFRKSEKEIATLRENSLYPDMWCPYCLGAAAMKCPEKLCKRGSVEKRKSVLAGHYPNNGGPIYRIDKEYVRCPTCRGKGKLRCPHCDEGVLK